MKEEFIQNAIVKWLNKNGWLVTTLATTSQRGVDIKAKHSKYGRYYLIETKCSSIPEVDFVYSLGQIITRMNSSGKTRYYYALGLPEKAASIALRRIPYQIAKKLLLHIFSVDDKGNVKRYMPKDIERSQKLK
jgi:hypothetical protein